MKSRSGYSRRPGYDAGGKQFYQRFPKRGFSNARFRTHYHVINVKVNPILHPKGAIGAQLDDVSTHIVTGVPQELRHRQDHFPYYCGTFTNKSKPLPSSQRPSTMERA